MLCEYNALFLCPSSLTLSYKIELIKTGVHAKIMVVDKAVAVVSSLNFTSLAGGGSSWEACVATKEDSIVDEIADSILLLIERPDSQEL